MGHNAELSQFLRSRRARLGPEEAGVATNCSPRRVPGLRREEVAYLAAVSTDYYARLEQGRLTNVSETVLEAIARALRLDAAEREYFFRLARPQSFRARRRRVARPQRVRPGVHRMLEMLDSHTPAYVLGRRLDVLAANRLARALMTDWDALPARERNLARFLFLDDVAKDLFADWPEVAAETVAALRLDAGRHPEDPQLTDLAGELSIKSPEFRTWWADHDVRERTHGSRRYHHPMVGDLTLEYEIVTFPGDPDQAMCVYTVEPASPSEAALRLLASWTGTVPTHALVPVEEQE